jgi:flagellar biosynthesis GTPase FlhF
MIPLDQIDSKTLKAVIGEINNCGLITPEQKIKPVGVSKADQIKKFTEVFENLQETKIQELAEKCKASVAFFHMIYKDELETPPADNSTVPVETSAEVSPTTPVEPTVEPPVNAEAQVKKDEKEKEKADKKAAKEAEKEAAKAAKEKEKADKKAAKEAEKEANKESRASRKGMMPDQIAAKAKDRYELMNKLVSEGTHTKKEIVALVKEAFPEVSTVTTATNLSDSKNPKYNKLQKLTKETEDGKFVFVD